jgi:hypothetical protein
MEPKGIRLENVKWVQMVQGTAQWPVLLNAVMFFDLYERQGTAWPLNDLINLSKKDSVPHSSAISLRNIDDKM